MFDIGWSELLVIAVVAIVVIGPKDLPRLMRSFGRFTGNLRRAAADFQRQFDEAVRDTEIDEVRQAMQDFHSTARSADLKAELDKPLMTEAPPQAAAGPAALPPPQAETVTPPQAETAMTS